MVIFVFNWKKNWILSPVFGASPGEYAHGYFVWRSAALTVCYFPRRAVTPNTTVCRSPEKPKFWCCITLLRQIVTSKRFSFQLSSWGGTSVKAVTRPCAVSFCLSVCISNMTLKRGFSTMMMMMMMPWREFLANCVPSRPSGHKRFAVCWVDHYLHLFLNSSLFMYESYEDGSDLHASCSGRMDV